MLPKLAETAGLSLVPPISRRQPADSPPTARRQHASQYVGVTVHRKRYVAQWGTKGKYYKSAHRLDAEGERGAAVARARGLGLDYIERRDGTREGIADEDS